jgi:hypothetical protein
MRKLLLASAACLALVSGLASKAAVKKQNQLAQAKSEGYFHSLPGNLNSFGYQGTPGLTTYGGVTYDYTCEAKRDENCLVNSIYLYGPKVVLVNLDDACQIEELELLGIFIQIGDLIIVTGRENACAW